MTADPLAPLLNLPGVADAAEHARDALGKAHRHRANLRGWPVTAAEASLRAARASAVLDGGAAAAGRRHRRTTRCSPVRCGWPRRSRAVARNLTACGSGPRCRRWPSCTRWPRPTWSTTNPTGPATRGYRKSHARLDLLVAVDHRPDVGARHGARRGGAWRTSDAGARSAAPTVWWPAQSRGW